MKLKDWWPAILVSPLVLCVPLAWISQREAVSKMREVDARVVDVQRYECPMGESGRRGRRQGPCWEITLEYRLANGKVRHKSDYSRGTRPRIGDWSSVLIGDGPSGIIANGTDANQARSGPI